MMKRSLLLGLGALTVSLASFACSSDPNKNAVDAHNAEAKSERKAQVNAADQRGDIAVDQAEYQRKVTAANAVGPDATQNRASADAKLVEARQVAKAKSIERLEKADAKASELRQVVNRAGGKATTQSRDALKAVDDQRVAAKTSIDQISTVPDDNFKQAKDYADSQLDTLEGYVKRAAKEVDSFK